MREEIGRTEVVFGMDWALLLINCSWLRSTHRASTEASLQRYYQEENLIIYTYVLGQIYFVLAFTFDLEKTTAAAEIPVRPL